MTVLASVGEEFPLTLVLNGGEDNLFPRAFIYDEAGTSTPIVTFDLSHVDNGYYRSPTEWLIPSAEKFVVVYVIYEDAARTIVSSIYFNSEDKIVVDVSGSSGGGVEDGLVGSGSL